MLVGGYKCITHNNGQQGLTYSTRIRMNVYKYNTWNMQILSYDILQKEDILARSSTQNYIKVGDQPQTPNHVKWGHVLTCVSSPFEVFKVVVTRSGVLQAFLGDKT